jgi:RND family efflux transporter MFP subunit
MIKKVWIFIKKRKWWLIVGLVILIVVLFASGKKESDYIFDTVIVSDVSETILATGQVVSDTDLTLSFSKGGIISSIPVSVGDKVSRGRLLVSTQNASERAGLTQAEAALAKAQASYDQTLEGSTSEEIEVSRVALANAEVDLAQSEIQQDRLVENAYRTLLSTDLEAIATINTSETAPSITGTYNSEEEGRYSIRMYTSGAGARFSVGGLELADGAVDESRPIPFGIRGLFVQFASGSTVNTKWSIDIPNTRSSSYVSNLNVYQAAQETRDITIATKQLVVNTAQANLSNLLAEATASELALKEADILSAQGQVDAALASLEDTRIRAPKSGTITRIDADLGSLIQAYENVVVLQDVDQLLLEANINEANITKVAVGMPIEVTFDAFSFDETFMAEVVSIDIASTLVSGVVNYRIKASLLGELSELRPGMTANMTLIVEEKKSVVAIPGRAVVEKDGRDIVFVGEAEDVEEVPVEIGFEGDGTLVEVLSGLVEGDQIVINP